MNEKSHIALKGEELARDCLQSLGYEILERNFRVGHKEIDIVARKDGVLVFCEVKTRCSHAYGDPAEAITRRKLALISSAAAVYMSFHAGQFRECRIDAVLVDLSGSQPIVTHLPNAYVHIP